MIACGGKVLPVNPIKIMKDKFKEKEAYTITLYDMDLREGNYVHRYKRTEMVYTIIWLLLQGLAILLGMINMANGHRYQLLRVRIVLVFGVFMNQMVNQF